MEEHSHPTPAPTSQPTTPAATTPPVIIQERSEPDKKLSGRSFVLGFLSAIALGLIGAVAFLAISDSDDDGNLEIDVPAVDVDVDG